MDSVRVLIEAQSTPSRAGSGYVDPECALASDVVLEGLVSASGHYRSRDERKFPSHQMVKCLPATRVSGKENREKLPETPSIRTMSRLQAASA